MKLYGKIAKAKKEIKETKLEKKGENKFSNYKYFTPGQIEQLVSDACENNGLITKFDLKRNEFGECGYLTIICIDTAESVVYEMATAIPEIKATNVAQQLGGCVTYTERYLKTSAFGIVDNSLDFDTTENTQKQYKEQENNEKILKGVISKISKCKTIAEITEIYNGLSEEMKVAAKPHATSKKLEIEKK